MANQRSEAIKDLAYEVTIGGAKKGLSMVQDALTLNIPGFLGTATDYVKTLGSSLVRAVKGSNNPKWYLHNEAYRMTNLDFGEVQPSTYPYSNSAAVGPGGTNYAWEEQSTPNVAAVSYHLAIPQGPQGRRQYRQAIARLTNALNSISTSANEVTFSQVSKYIYNVRRVDSAFHALCRLYKVYKTFSAAQTTLLNDSLVALGYAVEERPDLANLREKLLQARLNIIENLPGTYDMRYRDYQLQFCAYTDSTSIKNSQYFFRVSPASMQIITSKANATEITLTSIPWSGSNFEVPLSKFTVSNAVSALQKLLDTVVTDTDVGAVVQLWHKAFGIDADSSLFQVPEANEALVRLYDEEILTQLQNAKTLPIMRVADGGIQGTGAHVITKSDGVFIDTITSSLSSATLLGVSKTVVQDYYSYYSVNVKDNAVSPADVMVATRFALMADVNSEVNTWSVAITNCGTEVINDILAVNYRTRSRDETDFALRLNREIFAGLAIYVNSDNFSLNSLEAISLWSNIDWAPGLKVISGSFGEQSNNGWATPTLLDYDNAAPLPFNTEDNLHGYAVWSLLDKGVAFKQQSLTYIDYNRGYNNEKSADNAGSAVKKRRKYSRKAGK